MIKVDNILVSNDIRDEYFVCDLKKCKGACCVEGEMGAPLEESELPILKKILPAVRPYLTTEGRNEIKNQGVYVLDEDGDFSTPTINGKECAYSFYDDQGILKCGIEQAHRDGHIDFVKPISCHLYPIRITEKENLIAINYHEWDICSHACVLGDSLMIPLYVFLKVPLIRKFGEDWYNKLVAAITKNEV